MGSSIANGKRLEGRLLQWFSLYGGGSVNESGELDGWLIDKSAQIRLTPEDFTLLKDHAIKRCPDGSYLHTASANLLDQNDSAYAWRYDENFNVTGQSEVEIKNSERAHNDMASICSHMAQGVAFPSNGFEADNNVFFYLDENAAPTETRELPGEPRMTGGAFLTDVHENLIYAIGFGLFTKELMILTYDEDFNLLDQNQVRVLEGYRSYWSQGFLQVGDYFLVAMMGAEEQNGGGDQRPDPPNPAGDDGNVYLVVLDKDWNNVEEVQLTFHEPGWGGMRPWIARKGDQVLMTYDVMTEHSLVEVRLNIDAFGLDDSSPDTGVNPDYIPYYYGDDDEGGSDAGGEDTGWLNRKSCGGCSAGTVRGFTPWMLGIAALIILRRKQ